MPSSSRLIRPHPVGLTRRGLLASGVAAAGLFAMPAILRAANAPAFTHGVQSGDTTVSGGVVWTRVDRPARILLEVSTTESFADPRRIAVLNALPESDMAVKCLLDGLPADQHVFYRFTPTDLSDVNSMGQPITGRFRTAPDAPRNIRFGWSGDTAGQGWGIGEEGMTTYATMGRHELDFFIHSGDTIYADGPMKPEQEHAAGVWKNAVLIPEVEKVAETLDEFRGRYKYNQMDRHVQDFCAATPFYFQWDDHEVVNNWYPGELLDLPDVQALLHHLVGRRHRIGHREQGPRVAGGDRAVLDQLLDLERQGQQAEHVGDMASALAQRLRQGVLGMAELVHQPLVAFGLFQGGQVLPLDVLDQRDFQRFPVRELADDDRHLMQPGKLGRAPAALAGDDLVDLGVVRMLPDQQRLKDAALAHGIHEALDRFLVEPAPRLELARRHELDRHLAGLLALVRSFHQIVGGGLAEQRVEAAAEARAALVLFHQAISLFFSRFRTSLARWI